MRTTPRSVPPLVSALLLGLTGCADAAADAPEVQVRVGTQEVSLSPTQYCLDGDGRRYDTTPPIIEVPPNTTISLTVPDAVAEQGWSVQVFDDRLEEQLGEVDVDPGSAVFDEINSSDVVPAAFYLVVVENKPTDAADVCGAFTGAWPVGFIRPGAG